MMMKDSFFLVISNVLGRGEGPGMGPTNDDEGFFFSAVFQCFRNGVRGHTNDDEEFSVLC